MAYYAFVVLALSPRDGGWVRLFGTFPSGEDAWMTVIDFWELLVYNGDTTVDVRRTIVFGAKYSTQELPRYASSV